MALVHRLAWACALALVAIGCGFEHGSAVEPDAPEESITVAFGTAATMADETSGTVMIPVSLSAVSTHTITVGYTVGAGTAVRPDDFQLADGTLTFMAGQRDKTIDVAIALDAVEEPDETIVVQLAQPVGATLGARTSHTVTISSDILPRVGFAIATASIADEGTSPEVEVQLTLAPKQPVTVELGVAGTASQADRAIADGHVVTFAAGVTSQQVPLGIVQDTLDEDDETVVLALQNPSAKLILASTGTTRTHTISDDDPMPQVAFTQATTSVTEGTTTVSLAVQLSAVSGRDVTVPFSVAAASTAASPGDYTLASASPLVIPAGMTSANVVINVKGDSLDEANETVIVELGTPTNATLGAITSETLTINDDDPAPTVAFSATGSSLDEADASIMLTVQLSAISGRAVTVPFTIDAASTAVNPADYTIAPASQIVIPAGQISTTITIAVKQDSVDEPDETVIVVLDTPTNATLATPATYTLTIVDDD